MEMSILHAYLKVEEVSPGITLDMVVVFLLNNKMARGMNGD
jgi:hypothetical protein